MYRCELCGTVVPPRSKSQTVVTEKREKAYAPQQRKPGGKKGKGKGKGRRRWRDNGELPGGRGWEIVKESLVCGACAQRHESQEQEARAQAS